MEAVDQNEKDEAYSRNVAAGSYLLAHSLMEREEDDDRKQKMRNVLDRKKTLLNETYADGNVSDTEDVVRLLDLNPSADDEKTYFIDMAFMNPFSPYELEYDEDDFGEVLKQLSEHFSIDEAAVQEILDTKQDALDAHNSYDWLKIVGYGTAGVVALGLGGYFLAPALGAALGSAAGLAGAVATSHGLALLGGGSLAAGGAGMAGGLWLVTGTAAAVGGTAAGGGALIHQMGAAGARTELTKLQVTYKEVLLHNQVHGIKAQEAIKSLAEDRDQLKEALEEERELNEENAERVTELEEKIEAFDNAIEWMEGEAA